MWFCMKFICLDKLLFKSVYFCISKGQVWDSDSMIECISVRSETELKIGGFWVRSGTELMI